MKRVLGAVIGWVGIAIKTLSMLVIHARVWYAEHTARQGARGCKLLTELAVVLIRAEYWCYCRACTLRSIDVKVYLSDDIADVYGLSEPAQDEEVVFECECESCCKVESNSRYGKKKS